MSHHTHERKGLDKDRPTNFARDFAKMCIDCDAHAYIGHGPHIWRGHPQSADQENGTRILRDIAKLSAEVGTKISISEGIGTIVVK